MPSDVLGLIFDIAADPTKAEKAMAELDAASVAESGNISSTWSSAMTAMTGPTGIALGAIVGLGGGMLEMANKAAEAGNEVFEASEKTGIAADKISAIKALAKETGGSFDTLTVALSRAGVNMQNALMEPSAITAKVLAQVMGGAQNLANLGLKPMDERIQIVLQHIFALNDVGKRNQALNALMGRGWQQNVEVLELLARQGYGPAIEQAKKFGIYFDENAAKQAHAYVIEMHRLEGELSGLGLKIGSVVVPALAQWMAELHTVNYEVKLLEIGLEAQALSLINVGGIFDKQLDRLAQRATDLVAQEHQAMEAYKAEITAMGEAAKSVPGGIAEALAGRHRGAKGGAGGPFLDYEKNLKQFVVTIDGMTKSLDVDVQSVRLWESSMDAAIDAIPLATSNLAILDSQMAKSSQAAVQQASALQAAAKAMESDTAASAEGLAKSLAGLVAGRRAQAGVEAVWETARGIACLAEGAWPPNPAAIIAAGLHFEAAAEYALMAGSGGHRGSARAAGAAASGAGSSASAQGVERVGGGSSGGGSGRDSGQTIVQIQGRLSANGAQQMAAWLGMGSAVGLYKLNSQGSSGVNAPLY
jgi:hypothetical protein